MEQLQIGDWVQATRNIFDPLPGEDGQPVQHARRGNLGHVIDMRPGFLPTIFWESTNRVSDCEPEYEFKRLCDAETGRFPSPERKTA